MLVALICLTVAWQQALALQPKLSDQRMVFQTEYGDLEMAGLQRERVVPLLHQSAPSLGSYNMVLPAVYPDIAPVTAPHIMELAALGGYNTVSFFRQGCLTGSQA